jgi:hypothetical protein
MLSLTMLLVAVQVLLNCLDVYDILIVFFQLLHTVCFLAHYDLPYFQSQKVFFPLSHILYDAYILKILFLILIFHILLPEFLSQFFFHFYPFFP